MDVSGKPGYIASSAAHAAVLVFALFSFSGNQKFEDAQETIPVEMVNAQDFNQIMKGDKSAKSVQPKPRVDKVADTAESLPKPPIAEAKQDVPTPPAPLKRNPDPGEADKIEPPKPPTPQAKVTPPPEPAKTPPLPPVIERPQEDAEALEHKPKKDDVKKDTPQKDVAKPEPKFKLDQIAKLLTTAKVKPEKTAAKPKSGDENKDPPRKFNADDISRLLSKEAPQRRASTGRDLQQLASLGSPTASAARMSPSFQAQMDGWFEDHFKGCWMQPLTHPEGSKYVPEIRVPLNVDGSLAEDPKLMNPPDDTAWQPWADSALSAVHKCDPLPVPDIYKPYYDSWRDRIVRFTDDNT